ncbi:MFS transporter [Vibrio sp. 404]|uniref:MFS transporter n=1 Tax=Vibrio marinisediminis TaxID=2758441 RepID=A0A7W2IVU2_9VIBR|nr:MFS transporter [Vibrio marinisediminis]MBA5764377.1 MFS transporter [Vibrio marinisediminis]
MSLVSVPFVGTGADTALHIFATVVLVSTIAACAYGFWRFHELPINKAHSKDHHQIGLITALTWIGFIWHWVWVIAVILAFVDMEKAIINFRDTWRDTPTNNNKPEESQC